MPYVVIVGFFAIILATSNWGSPYTAPEPFLGCYSDQNGNRLQLSRGGNFAINGSSVGSYKILAPVGGKHGYLVETDGLRLSRIGDSIRATPGRHGYGYLWAIDQQSLRVIFERDNEFDLTKTDKGNC